MPFLTTKISQVDLVHLLASREQELRAISAEVCIFSPWCMAIGILLMFRLTSNELNYLGMLFGIR